jgi:hypothetical protein
MTERLIMQLECEVERLSKISITTERLVLGNTCCQGAWQASQLRKFKSAPSSVIQSHRQKFNLKERISE